MTVILRLMNPIIIEPVPATSAALSMANTIKDSIKTRVIAFLAADGVNASSVMEMQDALKDAGAMVDIIAPHLGTISGAANEIIPVNQSFLTAASVLYDAVYVPGGTNSVGTLAADPDAIHFLNEAFRHCKAIAADEDASTGIGGNIFCKKSSARQIEKTGGRRPDYRFGYAISY